MLPRIIVLSGGGIKAMSHIGALKVLEEAKYLAAVRTYVGLSAGALIAFGICLGYSLHALQDICDRFDFAALQDPAPEGFLAFLDHYGIDTGDRLVRFVQALLTIRGHSADMTFAQLAATGAPELRMVATNMCTGLPMVFSAAATPHVKLADGLRASMCLPFYFWPVRNSHSAEMLVDGGVHCAYPINVLSAEERRAALGILLSQTLAPWEDRGPDSYLLRLYEISSLAKDELMMEQFGDRTIKVMTPPISMIQFTLGPEQRAALLEAGRAAAEKFVESHSRRPRRRASIG